MFCRSIRRLPQCRDVCVPSKTQRPPPKGPSQIAMTFLFFAILLGIFSLPLLKGVSTHQGRMTTSGFDGVGVVMGFALTVAVAALTSPLLGIGFVCAALLHEFGSALACRIMGHEVARVRLIPLPFVAAPRSDRPFDHALEESFAALYAPALAIVPMILAFGLFHSFALAAPSLPMSCAAPQSCWARSISSCFCPSCPLVAVGLCARFQMRFGRVSGVSSHCS